MANKTCPKCGAPAIKSDGGWHCSAMCGHDNMSALEKHTFIQTNIKEIVNDFRTKGSVKTIDRWKISSSTLYNLPEIREIVEHKAYSRFSGDGAIPSLPEFSNDWTPEVQLKWLEIWEKVKV